MNRVLKISLTALTLVGLAATLAPQASAWTCQGIGPGGTVAQLCNEAHEKADYVVYQVERCLPDYVRWTCNHVIYP